jgi:hypothetical protein
MNGVKKICLSCRHFRLEHVHDGVCRVDRASKTTYPRRKVDGDCSRWQDCGQQYYIRLGWIKAKTKSCEHDVPKEPC